jgi:2-polyprenyl-6-methoxyphenol hydroxylase-like FAD-dependent oxidoreductase
VERVIIAGAGPAGLALACGLAQYGIETTVLERKDALDAHSRALVVWPRTLEIFRQWGMADAFLAAAPKRGVFEAYAAENGRRLTGVDLACIADQTAEPYALVLPQDRTEHLLGEAVRATGKAEILFGTELIACRDAGVRVEITAKRADGSSFTRECAYLVGADGARGFVREALGYDLEGKTYPLRTLIADVRIDDERDLLPSPRLAVLQRYVLAAIRYAEHSWRMIAVFPQDEIGEEDDLEALLPSRIETLLGLGAFATRWVNLFRTHARRAPRFRQGRIALIGDAAHLNSPAGGQGMNAGIADAHNLAWKLAGALRGGDAERLLASYDAERREAIASQVERFTDGLTRVASLPPKMRLAAIGTLDIAMRNPARARGAAKRMAMIDMPYGRSVLLEAEAERVGSRAPDVVVEGKRLYRYMDLDALLFVYHARSAQPVDEVALRGAVEGIPGLRVLLVDGDRSVARAWNASRSFAALIRPDHYIGWLSRSWTPESLRTGVLRALGSA